MAWGRTSRNAVATRSSSVAAVLRQRQVEQLLAQRVGERLPDRARRQRGEMVGDAVHERVRGAAKLVELFASTAPVSASLTSQA